MLGLKDFLLQETGDYLWQEIRDKFILDQCTPRISGYTRNLRSIGCRTVESIGGRTVQAISTRDITS